MQTVVKKYDVYSFDELSEDAKENAISKWYEDEDEDYPFLHEDLTEMARDLLKEKNIDFKNLRLYYSLSYCQGDGLCFTGGFYTNDATYEIEHNYRYYFAESVNIIKYDKDNSDCEEMSFRNPDTFMNNYLTICKRLEKAGYEILEYRMNNEEFSELCEANNYEFDENGNLL